MSKLNIKNGANWRDLRSDRDRYSSSGLYFSFYGYLRTEEEEAAYRKAKERASKGKRTKAPASSFMGARVAISKTTKDYGDTWTFALTIEPMDHPASIRVRDEEITQVQLDTLFRDLAAIKNGSAEKMSAEAEKARTDALEKYLYG